MHDNSGDEPGGERLAEVLAAQDVVLSRLAPHDDRIGDLAHRVAARDPLDRCHGAGAVVPGDDEDRVGQPVYPALSRVEGAVEEILQPAGHEAEVLGRAEDHRVGGEQVVEAGFESAHRANLDSLLA